MEKFEYLIYEAVDGRARITLNRPGKRNALSIPLLEELNTALWEAAMTKMCIRGPGRCQRARSS